MNFTSDDILKSLRNGINSEDLAKEFTDALNLANKTYEAEKKAKEAAEKKIAEEKALAAEKRENAISNLSDLLFDFADWYATYIDEQTDLSDSLNAEEIYDSIVDLFSLGNKFSDFYSKFSTTLDGVTKTIENHNGKVTKSINDSKKREKKTYEEIMNDFLKEFGL